MENNNVILGGPHSIARLTLQQMLQWYKEANMVGLLSTIATKWLVIIISFGVASSIIIMVAYCLLIACERCQEKHPSRIIGHDVGSSIGYICGDIWWCCKDWGNTSTNCKCGTRLLQLGILVGSNRITTLYVICYIYHWMLEIGVLTHTPWLYRTTNYNVQKLLISFQYASQT